MGSITNLCTYVLKKKKLTRKCVSGYKQQETKTKTRTIIIQ